MKYLSQPAHFENGRLHGISMAKYRCGECGNKFKAMGKTSRAGTGLVVGTLLGPVTGGISWFLGPLAGLAMGPELICPSCQHNKENPHFQYVCNSNSCGKIEVFTKQRIGANRKCPNCGSGRTENRTNANKKPYVPNNDC